MRKEWIGDEVLGAQVAKDLALMIGDRPFVLWLKGEMGAGKTTFTRYFLRALGLNPKEQVSSPTFSYVQDYEIRGLWYAHLDLYRISLDFDPEELGFKEQRAYHGLIVEWPERWPHLTPTDVLEIEYGPTLEVRRYVFYAAEHLPKSLS